MREIANLNQHERLMGKISRSFGRGHDVIFHGTRYATQVLRSGKLLPNSSNGSAICFTRSPETAAYFALLQGGPPDGFFGAVLVLNRRTLSQQYRLEPFHSCDWDENEYSRDEREERIWGRTVNFRRHLIGAVTEADCERHFLSQMKPEGQSLGHACG